MNKIKIRENVSLAPLTSFRIGGPARYFAEVTSQTELEEALGFAEEKKVPFYVLSGGTNLLVSDQGFAGLIVKMKINFVETHGEILQVGAGVPLIKAINMAAEQSLAGMESLAGIPGTVGGAVRGNAGAYGSEMSDVVQNVQYYDTEKKETGELAKEQCAFSYRSSFFKEHPEMIVLSVKLALQKGNKEDIVKKVQDTIAMRVAKGLHGIKSAGSFFMNPDATHNPKLLAEFEHENGAPSKNGKVPAGWIIEQAGLKGKRVGDAWVNDKHANYITNAGEAKAEDVIMLVSIIKQKLRSAYDVQIQQEVNYLGF